VAFRFYKTFTKEGIADGAVYEDSWTADEDLSLKRIHILRQTGESLTKSSFYFKIADRVYTRDIVPAKILGPDALISPVLDISFKKGEKFDFTFKNLEGVTIDIYISIETWGV